MSRLFGKAKQRVASPFDISHPNPGFGPGRVHTIPILGKGRELRETVAARVQVLHLQRHIIVIGRRLLTLSTSFQELLRRKASAVRSALYEVGEAATVHVQIQGGRRVAGEGRRSLENHPRGAKHSVEGRFIAVDATIQNGVCLNLLLTFAIRKFLRLKFI